MRAAGCRSPARVRRRRSAEPQRARSTPSAASAWRRVARALGIACWLLSAGHAGAGPAELQGGDAVLGKALAEKDCDACHARRHDGDRDAIYLRKDRRVKTSAQLLTQVQYCNAELGTRYFPDEEVHVAAYLNARYYHFE